MLGVCVCARACVCVCVRVCVRVRARVRACARARVWQLGAACPDSDSLGLHPGTTSGTLLTPSVPQFPAVTC